jgi:hypothetical protein
MPGMVVMVVASSAASLFVLVHTLLTLPNFFQTIKAIMFTGPVIMLQMAFPNIFAVSAQGNRAKQGAGRHDLTSLYTLIRRPTTSPGAKCLDGLVHARPADGALLHRPCTREARAHVTTRYQHAVDLPLHADGAFVGDIHIVFRINLPRLVGRRCVG